VRQGGSYAAARAVLQGEINLPAEAKRELETATRARRLADDPATKALASTARAVKVLRERLGLSVRDIGEMLGLSHQRVQQLCRGER